MTLSNRKLALCTPIYRHTTADFTASLLKTYRAYSEVPMTWLNVVGEPNCSHARNILIAEGIRRGATDIIFIDDDVGWEPESLEKLFAVPEECLIVAGAPQRRQRDTVSFCSNLDPENPKKLEHLISGFAAMAFTRIDVKVFDTLAGAVPYEYPGGQCKSWFFHDIAPIRKGVPAGFIASDYYFSRQCKEQGMEVWIDPEIALRHHSSVALTACMADFLKS